MGLIKKLASQYSHRLHELAILVLMPYSRCNCRCIMCDIWKADGPTQQLDPERFGEHLHSIRALGIRRVVFSGGEPLIHPGLWRFCEMLAGEDVSFTLLSTGILMEKHAANIARYCRDVVVSLDGPPDVHDEIRQVEGCAARLGRGVRAIKALKRGLTVTGRMVVQRLNSSVLPETVDFAHELGLDGISFLGADVSTTAFNRPYAWPGDRRQSVVLGKTELDRLQQGLNRLIVDHRRDFDSGFILDSPAKLQSINQYFQALLGEAPFPPIQCNAPWVSAVIEPDGLVRPCFFQPPYPKLERAPLAEIVNSPEAVRFRRTLKVSDNPVCRKCVCTLYRSPFRRSCL